MDLKQCFPPVVDQHTRLLVLGSLPGDKSLALQEYYGHRQNRFWDLKVDDSTFTVGLSFGGVPATLLVPFAAVTSFHDPAVEFLLTFQADAAEDAIEAHDEPGNDPPDSEESAAERVEDGSNVVSVDFTRKK